MLIKLLWEYKNVKHGYPEIHVIDYFNTDFIVQFNVNYIFIIVCVVNAHMHTYGSAQTRAQSYTY